jgi:DNA repair protein RadC
MNRLKETASSERPYERAVKYGPGTLTDAELIAVLLRTGTKGSDVIDLSNRILGLGPGQRQGINGILHHTYEEYLQCRGIGKVKAVQLLCIGELSRRMWRREISSDSVSFDDPSACAGYYMEEMRHLEQEELRIAFLDTRHRLMCDQILTRGTVDSSVVSVREIMISSLKHMAVNVILIHNHPSGNPNPSDDDLKVTHQVNDAGKLIGIRLTDHIIIGDNTYYSFKEWGTL